MATESQIDPTVIKDDQPVDKADLREQFTIARDEITTQIQQTSLVRRMAYDGALFTRL